MRRTSPPLLLSLLLLLPALAAAETIVTASIDRDTITVGDPITLTIRLEAPTGEEAELPAIDGDRIGPFEILEISPVHEETREGVRSGTRVLRITAFLTGGMEIPSLRSEAGGVGSAPIPVTVLSVGVDPSGDIRDVKKPISLGRDWLGLLLPALLLLLAAAGIFLLRRRRRKKAPAPVLRPADLRPAHVIAIESLARLEGEHAGPNGVPRAFYFRLSAVVRDYIDRRYALPAPERTTREILREIRKEKLDSGAAGLLRELLLRCDLVKFRGDEPPRAEAEEALRGAREFVEKTREKGTLVEEEAP
ncbi:MAG: hypothetical protein ABIH26_15065 [Candidatus Eisenbacteria bacterium]